MSLGRGFRSDMYGTSIIERDDTALYFMDTQRQ